MSHEDIATMCKGFEALPLSQASLSGGGPTTRRPYRS